MATGYQLVTSEKVVQVISAGQAIDAMQLGFITTPSNIYMQRYVPYSSWLLLQGLAGLDFWVIPIRDAVENSIANGEAVGAAWRQDVDPVTNLLTDFADFFVGYTPPGGLTMLTDTVSIPIDSLTISLAGGQIVGLSQALAAALNRLITLAG